MSIICCDACGACVDADQDLEHLVLVHQDNHTNVYLFDCIDTELTKEELIRYGKGQTEFYRLSGNKYKAA